MKTKDEICCPEFDPTPWDDKMHEWDNRLFIKDTMFIFMHMPFPAVMGKKIGGLWEKAKAAGAEEQAKDFLLLSHDPSPWKGELYMSVTKEVPGAENVKISGTYYTKAFEGPYSAVPQWMEELKQIAVEKDVAFGKIYFYYTTCPKCAKKYGKNYVVAVCEVK
ncbi:hypothetical protein GF357_03605 [Candidatus Dojkabacteria bacterium]|nr:hypothetical protein [Candidatus Dojkabacteria bacterium]